MCGAEHGAAGTGGAGTGHKVFLDWLCPHVGISSSKPIMSTKFKHSMKDETFSSFIFTVSMLQDPPHLSYAVSFLPLARSSQMLDYYTNIKQEKLCDDTTEIVAMDLGECGLELATKVHEVFTIMEKAPLSWSPSSRTFVSSSIWGMFRIQDTAQNQACRCYWGRDRGNWELPVTLPLWCSCDAVVIHGAILSQTVIHSSDVSSPELKCPSL